MGQDLLLRALQKFPGLTPLRLALFFVAIGFGSLFLFYLLLWELESPLMRLRGLFSYYSATLGDGLLIPFGIAVSASCLRSISKLVDHCLSGSDADVKRSAQVLTAHFRGRALGWIPGSLALVTTIAVHIIWLFNPRTEGNWTIVPGHLNFFGWWHAVFFFIVLWWYLAFLGRLVLASYSLLGRALPASLASASLEIWGELNALMGAVVGFTTLLYIDNYGLRFSWRTLLSSITTLSNILFTLVVLLTINLYFALAVYRPIRKRVQGEELKFIDLMASRAWIAFVFASLLAASLVLLGAAVSASHAWAVAAIVAGVVVPVLFTENYAADLFWNYGWTPDSVDSLGICLTLVISSGWLLNATAVVLSSSHGGTIHQILIAWGRSLPISFLALVVCSVVAWTASLTVHRMPGRELHLQQLKDLSHMDKPMANMRRNFLQFWCLFQLIVIPIAISVYHEELRLSAEVKIAIFAATIAVVGPIVYFPLNNNHSHLNALMNSTNPPSSYNAISTHISFLSIYVGALTLFTFGWLAVSLFGSMLWPK